MRGVVTRLRRLIWSTFFVVDGGPNVPRLRRDNHHSGLECIEVECWTRSTSRY